jgi:hypothetical protein
MRMTWVLREGKGERSALAFVQRKATSPLLCFGSDDELPEA